MLDDISSHGREAVRSTMLDSDEIKTLPSVKVNDAPFTHSLEATIAPTLRSDDQSSFVLQKMELRNAVPDSRSLN
jgi:hypothetical protein